MIEQHVLYYLISIIDDAPDDFNKVYDKIHSELKPKYKDLLHYLDKVINYKIVEHNNELEILHIHIQCELSDSEKLLFAEYLILKFFYFYNATYEPNNDTPKLNNIIRELEAKSKILKNKIPTGAKSTNGGNKIYKTWMKEIEHNKLLYEFYKHLNKNASLKSKLIFNTQETFGNKILDLFEFEPYIVEIEKNYYSYNIINKSLILDEIDNQIVNDIETIVLFDCDRKALMSNYFSLEKIKHWNNTGANFKNYLIFSYGKGEQCIENTRNKIRNIEEKFNIPKNKSYLFLKEEIDLLLNREEFNISSVEFIGDNYATFWQEFLDEVQIKDLYELKSIKLMNIYSLCISDEIKRYILDELFSEASSSDLISFKTKQAILELRIEDIAELKSTLANVLDLIISLDIKSIIVNELIRKPNIVIDDAIFGKNELLDKFKKALNLHSYEKSKFVPWSETTKNGSNDILILSYRDQGFYKNTYYPNLFEFRYKYPIKAIFPKFLFSTHFAWAKYNLFKEYIGLLKHPFREKLFNINNLNNQILNLKPMSVPAIDWNLETSFSNPLNRELYKVTFRGQKPKSIPGSTLIIFSQNNGKIIRVQKVKWIYDNLDISDSEYNAQSIDELLDDFNPAEKLIDYSEQERELAIIRKEIGVANEDAIRIWKVLLNKKSKLTGPVKLYNDIKVAFDKNNLKLVSEAHFQNSWINLKDDSIMPRGNKVFKVLCDYLGLKSNYRLILHKLKNISLNGKKDATRRYSNLLIDLFSDGCFDENTSASSILNNKISEYKNNHSFEELGIDSEKPIDGLLTLIDLIKTELRLVRFKSIEKLSNE